MASSSPVLPALDRVGFFERIVRGRLASTSVQPLDLLCIAGVDSDSHPANEILLKYLLLGSSDASSTVLRPQEAALDDSVLLLRGANNRGAVNFTPRQNALLNTLASDAALSSLKGFADVRALKDAEMRTGDSEAAELYKILAFIDMVAPSRRLGMALGLPPASGGGKPAPTPASLVEMWPLVQAFALQDIGPGGFFTQRVAVTDVAGPLAALMGHVDSVVVRRLTRADGPAALLARQWRAFEALVHSIRNLGRRATVLSCEAIAEPLVSFSEFSRMQQEGQGQGVASTSPTSPTSPKAAGGGAGEGQAVGAGDVQGLLARGARMLVGRFTGRDASDPVAAAAECASLPLAQCGFSAPALPPLPALHAVVEADHPSAGLRVARTVFLAGGRAQDSALAPALSLLTSAYASLTAAFHAALPTVAVAMAGAAGQGQGDEVVAAAGAQALLKILQALPSAAGLQATAGVQLIAADGRTVASCTVGHGAGAAQAKSATAATAGPIRPRRLAYLRVSLGGLSLSGQPLGSCGYGDTVLLIPTNTTTTQGQGHGVGAFHQPPQPFAKAGPEGVVVLPSTAAAVGAAAGPGSTPSLSVRVLTSSIPASLHWTAVGDGEGKACQEVGEALARAVEASSSSSGRAGARAGQGAGAAGAGDDPYAVGRYGRTVGSKAAAGGASDDGAAASAPASTSTASAPAAPAIPDVTPTGGLPGLLASMGRAVASATPGTAATAPVAVLTGGTLRPLSHGNLQVFQRGLALTLPGEGPVLLSLAAHITDVALVLGGDALDQAARAGLGQAGSAVSWATGRAGEGVKAAQATWLDSKPTTVEAQTLALVEAQLQPVAGIGAGRTAAAAPGTSSASASAAAGGAGAVSPGAAAEAALSAPRDILVLSLRDAAGVAGKAGPEAVLAGRLSSSPALWHGAVVGLVIPSEGGVRAALLELLPVWREALAEGGEAPGQLQAAGGLPQPLQPGYLSLCSTAGPLAWVAPWEDEHLAEACLHADAQACSQQGTATAGAGSAEGSSGSYLVTLVVGAAGSGARAVAEGVVDALGGRASGGMPLVAAECLTGQPLQDSVQAALAKVVQGMGAGGAGAGGGRAPGRPLAHVLLVAPAHAAPQTVVQAVLASSAPGTPAPSIHGVITCLNARQTHEDARAVRPLPGLFDQVMPGWAGAVLVLSPLEKGDGVSDGLVAQVRHLNPQASVVRHSVGPTAFLGPGGRLTLPYGLANGLMSEAGAVWASARAAAYRHVLGSGAGSASTSTSASEDGGERMLHVYAPEDTGKQAGGATVGQDGSLISRPVVAWLPVPSCSTTTLSLPPALEEGRLLECLRALVCPRVDRPDLALLGDGEGPGALKSIPGVPVAVTVADPVGGAGGERRGTAYAAAWHATGLVRVIHSQGGGQAGQAGGSSASTSTSSSSSSWSLMGVEATPHAIRLSPWVVTGDTPAPAPYLTLTGVGLHLPHMAAGVRDALLACRPMRMQPFSTRGSTTSTLLPRERVAVVRAHPSHPLPPDITFDGTSYWSMAGEQLGEHPLLPFFACRYLVVHDAAVGVVNALVARVAQAVGEEEASSTRDNACMLTWPLEGDKAQARLTVPVLPVGVGLPDLPGYTATEPLTLPLPEPVSAPWWEQQGRAVAWLAQVLRTVIAD